MKALILTLLFALTACGGSDDEDPVVNDTPGAPRNVCAPDRSNCV